MKKIMFGLIILISVSTIAYSGELPNLPVRYHWDHAWIEVGGTPHPGLPGDVDPPYCGAFDEDSGESIGNNTDLYPSTIKFMQVVINKNKVKAICKFTDESGTYSEKAQVGDIVDCSLITGNSESGFSTFWGGTGHITAAANHGDEPGGNVTIECTFDPDDCVYGCD